MASQTRLLPLDQGVRVSQSASGHVEGFQKGKDVNLGLGTGTFDHVVQDKVTCE